jgi:hypothetical protein
MTSVDLFHKWTPWTGLSTAIPFKCVTAGKGDGEDRVAAEFHTVALGQNSNYDMMVEIGGSGSGSVNRWKADVKKLDNLSFNTGVSGRDALRPIKAQIDRFLMTVAAVVDSPLLALTAEQKRLFTGGRCPLVEASPDEVAAGTIETMERVAQLLNSKQAALRASLPGRRFRDPLTAVEKNITAEQFYKICSAYGKTGAEISGTLGSEAMQKTELLVHYLDHPFISDPASMRRSLNGLTWIFDSMLLIFVDEEKGYYLLKDLSKLSLQRITKGSPRFVVVL